MIQSNSEIIVQNFLLVWLHDSLDETKDDFQNSLIQLRSIVNTVHNFTNADQCVDFITDINDETIFMIISRTFGEIIIPIIHNISQLDSIFVLCNNTTNDANLAQSWSKVKGVFTQISHICDFLQK